MGKTFWKVCILLFAAVLVFAFSSHHAEARKRGFGLAIGAGAAGVAIGNMMGRRHVRSGRRGGSRRTTRNARVRNRREGGDREGGDRGRRGRARERERDEDREPTGPQQSAEEIKVVQVALTEIGCDPGEVDGVTSERLTSAVRCFQQKAGEQPNGKLTDGQIKVLAEVYERVEQRAADQQRSQAMGQLIDTLGVKQPGGTTIDADTASSTVARPAVAPASDPNAPAFMTASAETSFRSICGDGDVVRSALREAAAMPAAKMLPDQFCVARSQVIAEAFKNLKTISVQKGGIKIEAVREACARFAESKRELKAMLASEDPAALIQRITKTPKGSASVQRESEIANSRVCLGVGYGDEAPDMALASLLYLMSLGQTGYGELIGAHFALGIGVAKDRQRAIAWLDYAAAEIAAGRPAIVTGEGQPRGQTLRLMVDELKTASAALSGLVSEGSVPVASEGPQFDGPQFASPPAETKQVGLNLVPGRPVEEPQTHKAARSGDVFDQLRDNVVFIWNGNGHGTGFFISPTHILTNAHVVKNIDQVLVVGKGLKVRPGKPPMIAAAVRFRGIDIDAAILEVSDYRHPTYLPFAAEAREGEQISIGGYPAKALKLDRGFTQFKELIAKRQAPTSAQIPTIRFDSGRVQSVFTENSSRLENIQVGVNATGGNSGSPIINACGDVIGLFYAGTRSYVRRTGEVEDPGDFNFAIASKEVAKFLKDAGISVQQNAGKCSS